MEETEGSGGVDRIGAGGRRRSRDGSSNIVQTDCSDRPRTKQLVDTWLKVQRAQEMGMVVSDDTINEFLEQWTGRPRQARRHSGGLQAHAAGDG